MTELIPALQKDQVFLADLETARSQPDQLHIWWLGQSGFLLQWQGRRLVFDPYLSDSLSVKYAQTDKPHVRMSERVVDPAQLRLIDVVMSSHKHTDHLDAETLLPLFKANPDIEFVIPEANRAFVTDRLKCDPNFPTGLNDGETAELSGFIIHGVPAAHNELERDHQGRYTCMGFVVQAGPWTIYHSGDTLWYDGMVDVLKPFRLDIAFLPINGNKPERRVAGNLSAEEAARLGKEIGAGLVIPHHYHLFEFNTEDPAVFVREAQRYQTPYRVLQLGERWSGKKD